MSRGKAIEGFGARTRAKEAARPAPSVKVRDTHDERAEKAERVAHAQHSTSLLSRGDAPARGSSAAVRDMALPRGAELPRQGKGMPFLLQVVMVMALAGAAAFGVSIYAPELMYSVL